MSAMTVTDVRAHEAASFVRSTPTTPKPQRRIIERFPAGAPRGSWPAEEFAAARRREGIPAFTVMDLASDAFLVVVEEAS